MKSGNGKAGAMDEEQLARFKAARRREAARRLAQMRAAAETDPCIRAENEDDDGYDPYSDRRPEPEPLFEENPWD